MNKLTVVLLLLLASSGARAQYTVDTLQLNGSPDSLINLVFLSDGFQANEMASFKSGVDNVLGQLFQTVPFQQYKSYFNVFAIEVPSKESGASHPGTAFDEPGTLPVSVVDNNFKSTFDANHIHRLLVPNYISVIGTLFLAFPNYSQAFVLVNSQEYGGSGGQVATASLNTSSAEVAIHEIGHSFAGLGDEYGSGTPYPGSETPNTTAHTERDSIAWHNWIDASTPLPTPASMTNVIGLFEGAAYNDFGWYRPKAQCKMRSLGYPLCEVCTEAFVERFHALVKPVSKVSPSTGNIDLLNAVTTFELFLREPEPNTLRVEWSVDGNVMARNISRFNLKQTDLTTGAHTLVATVLDTTSLSRSETQATDHIFATQWNLTVPANQSVEMASSAVYLSENPSRGRVELNLGASRKITLRIVDVLGRERYRFDGTAGPMMELPSTLDAGIYWIEGTADQSPIRLKMVRE